ncbi:MAG TPA: hypothetical protein VLV18_08680 [Terriglobales bacterium]|nr:hypothetical protein [Terriglobales bacterium]
MTEPHMPLRRTLHFKIIRALVRSPERIQRRGDGIYVIGKLTALLANLDQQQRLGNCYHFALEPSSGRPDNLDLAVNQWKNFAKLGAKQKSSGLRTLFSPSNL